MAKSLRARLMFWSLGCLLAFGCGGGGGGANGGGRGGTSAGAAGRSGVAGAGGKAGLAGAAGAAEIGVAGAQGAAGDGGTAGSSGSAGDGGGGTVDPDGGAAGGGGPSGRAGAAGASAPSGVAGVPGGGASGVPGPGTSGSGGAAGTPPSGAGENAAGAVVAETSVQITSAQQVVIVGPARVTIPAGALPADATLILRLLSGVMKPGGAPIRGLTMQFLPATPIPAPSLPLLLELPSPGPGTYEAISAAEAAPGWTRDGPAHVASGYVAVGVPRFSLWSASPAGPFADWLEQDPLTGPAVISTASPPVFAGLQSAAPASRGGGVELRFAAATPGPSRYLLYVRAQGETYDFQRAYAVVTADQVNYVAGLATERTWCFTVRYDGNANMAEACAAPAVTPPQRDVPAFMSGPTAPWTDTVLDLQWVARAGAGYRYDLERRSSGGSYETRASKTIRSTAQAPADLSFIGFADVADAPGTYDYRVRAFADGVETGLSAVKTVEVVKKAWRQPLERGPRVVSGPPLSPRVAVDGGGNLIYDDYVSAAPAAQFLAGARKVASLRPGPAIAGNREPWRRLLGVYDDVGAPDPGNQWIGWARGADGTLWVLDSSQALVKIGTSGPAQIWNTAVVGGFNLVAHPTDPAKLAVAGASGVWVTNDGGVTFRLFSDVTGSTAGVAYAPDGTLFAVGTHLAQSSDGGLSWFNYGSWPTPSDPPGEIALSPDGSLMAVSLPSALPRAGVWIGTTGGTLEYSDVGLSHDHLRHLWAAGGLTFLSDGRLVLVVSSADGGDAGAPTTLACVRSLAGTWTTFELPGRSVSDGALQVQPVFFDLRAGHEGDYYHARLRTRDGGVTWELNPTGRAVGATTTSSGQFVLLTLQQPDAALPATSHRSTDGGDTATLLTGVTLPADGSVWFNPASPLTGVTSAGTFTTDGGATWVPSPMGGGWSGVGFADAGHVLATAFNANPLRSTDGGASFAPFDGVRSNAACGNGARALLARGAAGTFLSYTSTAQETVTNMAFPGMIRACGLSADGATVYLLTSSTLWKGKAGIAGSLSRLPFAPTATTNGPTPLIVSPDGMKISARGSYSDTGGE